MFSDCISGIHVDFMSFLKRLHACGSSRVSFAIVCLGTCLSLLNWLKEWRNCILELIKCPFQSQMIQLEEPSTTWNHMCMNLRMVRMPQVLDPILRTSGKCLHTAVCHHGKRAEVKTLAVKICTKCLSNDIKRFPHTSEVYVDWNDCVHQSRVCEDFHRRYSHLSDIAVKRIVKKCRHCF